MCLQGLALCPPLLFLWLHLWMLRFQIVDVLSRQGFAHPRSSGSQEQWKWRKGSQRNPVMEWSQCWIWRWWSASTLCTSYCLCGRLCRSSYARCFSPCILFVVHSESNHTSVSGFDQDLLVKFVINYGWTVTGIQQLLWNWSLCLSSCFYLLGNSIDRACDYCVKVITLSAILHHGEGLWPWNCEGSWNLFEGHDMV